MGEDDAETLESRPLSRLAQSEWSRFAPRLLALVRYNWAKASGLILLHSMLARCTLPIRKHRVGCERMGLDIVEFVMDVEEEIRHQDSGQGCAKPDDTAPAGGLHPE